MTVFFSTLVAAVGATGGKTGAPAGNFSSWILAMEWQPAWNLQACENTWERSVIAHTTNTSWAATHLSLHGLWPNYQEGWPQYCKGPLGDFTACESHSYSDLCTVQTETSRVFNTSGLWQRYALEYSWSDLGKHEWGKHGGCSGWDQIQFFDVVNKTLQRILAMKGPQQLSRSAGGSISLDMVNAAFDNKASLKCNTHCSLTGVQLHLEAGPSLEPGNIIDFSESDTSCNDCKQVMLQSPKPCGGPAPSPPGPAPSPPGPAPKDHCVRGKLGPECKYDPKTAGTDQDACKQHAGCLRCASSNHGGHHYCTAEPKVIMI